MNKNVIRIYCIKKINIINNKWMNEYWKNWKQKNHNPPYHHLDDDQQQHPSRLSTEIIILLLLKCWNVYHQYFTTIIQLIIAWLCVWCILDVLFQQKTFFFLFTVFTSVKFCRNKNDDDVWKKYKQKFLIRKKNQSINRFRYRCLSRFLFFFSNYHYKKNQSKNDHVYNVLTWLCYLSFLMMIS